MGLVIEDVGVDVTQQNITESLADASVTAATGTLLAAGITGLGCYLPERVLTNDDLEHFVDTTDEWIVSRTGIRERHIAAPNESTADLAERAARLAMQDAGVGPEDIDLIIVATCTPDYQFPSTASLLQDRLKCSCAAFDLGAACSGFVYSLVVAQQFIATRALRTVLVVGAEVMSRIVDWTDRGTCVLFGDGAGAAVVQPVESGFGLLSFDLGSDGSGGDLLKVAIEDDPTVKTFAPIAPCATCAGDGNLPPSAALNGNHNDSDGNLPRRRIFQNGREVYRFAVKVMGESAVRALAKSGIKSEDIDLLVPHQANIRIIDAAANRLGLPPEKVFINVEKYGNTSGASIPIALYEAREQGRLKHGDTVVTVGFGGGLTWAAGVMKWVNKRP
ncbi:MAG: ketoacyl-ACP synthase III [Abitibacteriaceae bacterium]|nr:ketoacyl-ACP synthase III [Abditibacteriaceae bacterium]